MKISLVAVALIALVGCAELSAEKRDPTLREKCPPGSSKECVLSVLGAPERASHVGGREVWFYPGPNGGTCQAVFDKAETIQGAKCFDGGTPPRYGHQAPADPGDDEMTNALQGLARAGTHYPADTSKPTGECLGLPPLGPIGCHMACISGSWQSVCP